jgi:hypothetical protein
MYQNCYIMHIFPSLFCSSISSVLQIAASMFMYEHWSDVAHIHAVAKSRMCGDLPQYPLCTLMTVDYCQSGE